MTIIKAKPYFYDARQENPSSYDGPKYSTHCVYLHGKLWYDLGTDCLDFFYDVPKEHLHREINWRSIVNGAVVEVSDPLYHEEVVLEGGFDVQIEGVDKPCFGFFHTDFESITLDPVLATEFNLSNNTYRSICKLKGLIVYKDELEDILDAARKYIH